MAHSDRDLFAQWAATEFIAAGRAHDPADGSRHRQRARLYADICSALDVAATDDQVKPRAGIAAVLFRAFDEEAPELEYILPSA